MKRSLIVTVTEESSNGPVQYPCIMKDDKGTIVLFSKHKQGTVIGLMRGNTSYHRISEFNSCWEMTLFTLFEGVIKISQCDIKE